MPYVIRRKEDGKFAYGRHRWSTSWVEECDKARVYPTRGNATTSLRQMFLKGSRTPLLDSDAYEILPVKVVLAE